MKSKNKISTRSLTQFAILLAIELVLGFTPLGMITIPVVGIAFTTMHIPVIIAAITLGWRQGALLGFAFGLISLIKATASGTAGDLLFSPFASGAPLYSIIMGLIPRILLGVFAALLFVVFSKLFKSKTSFWSIALSAGFSTVLHSVMVLGLMSIFFQNFPLKDLFGIIISVNGLLELLMAVLVCPPVCKAVLKYN